MSEFKNNYKQFNRSKRKQSTSSHQLTMENNQKKTTTEQFTVLVKEMQKNPNIDRATPIFGYNRTKMETFWNSLTSRLNALGPKQRTTAEWKKVWSELKLRTKRKNSLGDLTSKEPQSDHHCSRATRNTGAASSSSLTTVNQFQGHSCDASEATTSKQHKCANTSTVTSSPLRVPQSYAKSHGGGVGNSGSGGGSFENETLFLLRRQVECEENLVSAVQRANELKLQQLKLMEQQNQLMAVTIEGVQQLSSKLMEFLENN